MPMTFSNAFTISASPALWTYGSTRFTSRASSALRAAFTTGPSSASQGGGVADSSLARGPEPAPPAGAAGRPAPTDDQLVESVLGLAEALFRPSLRPVINATGVIIHTNLGRAPLPEDAIAPMAARPPPPPRPPAGPPPAPGPRM